MLHVVTGPPAAGKTTYAREHAQPGDVIIDYDAIAVALGSPDTHDHPQAIRRATQAARSAALAAALKAHATIWLIHTMPTPTDLAHYRRLKAQVITVDPGQDIVTARIAASRPTTSAAIATQWYKRHNKTQAAQRAADYTGV